MENKEILKKFFTNPFGRVTCFTSLMKQVDAGAIFSRYSRSPDIAEDIFIKEFLENSNRGEDFYKKVLALYGDDSIAELGGAHIMFQGISQLASKELEDIRIGLSPLEKSTRYVNFGNKNNDGRFKYIIPYSIMNSKNSNLFEKNCDNLFETYINSVEKLTEWAKNKFPQNKNETERAFNNSRKAKALDISRGLLPAATQTNVGIYGNGRAFEYLLLKMKSSPLNETTELSNEAFNQLTKVIPAFVKRIEDNTYSETHLKFIKERDEKIRNVANEFLCNVKMKNVPEVEMIIFKDDTDQIVSRILYEGCELPLSQIKYEVEKMNDNEKQKIINIYLNDRNNRRHKPGRAFETQKYVFDINADFGIYRDLQRHRLVSQMRQRLTTKLGFDTPKEIKGSEIENDWNIQMKNSNEVFKEIEKDNFFEAQYVVPFAYKVRWYMAMVPREIFWMSEIRTTPQGHPNYRRVVNKIWDIVSEKYPLIFNSKIVKQNNIDCEKNELERQKSEMKIDEKMKNFKN